jgi:hypothetical protein
MPKKAMKNYNLQVIDPSLSAEWLPFKNDNLNPKDVTPNSHKMVWWICNNKHEWRARVANRRRGSGWSTLCYMREERFLRFGFSKHLECRSYIKVEKIKNLEKIFKNIETKVFFDHKTWNTSESPISLNCRYPAMVTAINS